MGLDIYFYDKNRTEIGYFRKVNFLLTYFDIDDEKNCKFVRITKKKFSEFVKDIFDKVKYFGREYFIKGRMSHGYAVLMDIYGKKVEFSHLGKGNMTPKLTLCKRISSRRNQLMCVEKI